jgi:hypothetical protein
VELLDWLVTNAASVNTDCTDLVPSVVVSLQDKNAVVRGLAEKLMILLIQGGWINKYDLIITYQHYIL